MEHRKHFDNITTDDLSRSFGLAGINLVTFPEPSSPRPFPFMPHTELRAFQLWLVKEPWKKHWGRVDKEVRDHFGDSTGHRVLAHVEELLDVFTGFTHDPAPFVSLRTVDKTYIEKNGTSVSAGYHRDASFLTLQHTMTGEPLQWARNGNVRRGYFDTKQIQPASDPDDLVLFDPDDYEAVPDGTVAILKGELRSDEQDAGTIDFLGNFIDSQNIPDFNRDGGLIHRGDKTTHNGRMVLTITTHQQPEWMPS